jgi:long-chain acyl-CoA synthetase
MAMPCAVAVLTPEALKQATTEAGRKELAKSFEDLLLAVNAQVEHHEQLAFIALVNTPWTMDNGFVTPTLKLKRTPLESFYAKFLPTWLAQGTRVVWQLTD